MTPPDAQTGNHSRQRYRGIGQQMQIGAALVQVGFLAPQEQRRGPQIHQDAEARHGNDQSAGDLRWILEASDGLPEQGAAETDQKHRVEQGRQLGGAAPAEGMAFGRCLAGHPGRAPGQGQTGGIAEVVQGIRNQCQRIEGQTEPGLDGGIRQIDPHRPCEHMVMAGMAMVMGTVRVRVHAFSG